MSMKYSKDHEWVRVEGDVATVGITNHAQEALGEVVFVELPEVDSELSQNDAVGVVESVKAASDVMCPISGTVVEINPVLEDEPEKVNEDPYGDGWFFKIKPNDTSQLNDLMDEEAYNAFVESES